MNCSIIPMKQSRAETHFYARGCTARNHTRRIDQTSIKFFFVRCNVLSQVKNTIDWQAQVFGYNIVQCRHPMLRNTGYIYLEIFESSLFASLLIRIKLINCNEGNFYMTTCSLG